MSGKVIKKRKVLIKKIKNKINKIKKIMIKSNIK